MSKTASKSLVKLRKKKLTNGDYSLYLDIYNNGRRSYDFLKLYMSSAPKTLEERKANKEKLSLADSIRSKKELEINHSEHGFIPEHRKRANFITIFEKYKDEYSNKDKRLVNAVFEKFKKFLGKDFIACNEIDKEVVIRFRDYLQSKLNGESPSNYFKKFKKVLKYAYINKYMIENPSFDITVKRNRSIKKEVLFIEEIQLLANTLCSNREIKRAFLFCCYTGLRFGDVKSLQWKSVSENSITATDTLKKTQNKTEREVIINLNETAKSLIGPTGLSEDLVFNLPTIDGYNKVLGNWVKNAGINKKITSHCARHSFGTNLYFYSNDIKSTASLMGHSTTKETEKYVRLVESLKLKATESIPKLQFK